jgi:hypothetical protein
MVSMFRWLAFFIVVLLVLAGGAYVAAGRTTPATIVIDQPGGPIGQQGTLQFTAGSSRGFFTKLEASLEQNGKTFPLFDQAAPAADGVTVKHVDADHLQVTASNRQDGHARPAAGARQDHGHRGAPIVTAHS